MKTRREFLDETASPTTRFDEMTRTAMDVARRHCGARIVSLLEGGYNVHGLTRAATAHLGALLGG